MIYSIFIIVHPAFQFSNMAVDYQLTHTTHEKRLDLKSDIFQLLFSSEHAFQVPPFVNDIAAVLP